MAAPNYSVLGFDMAVARTAARIIDVGTLIDAVVVLSVPAGALPQLHFGANRDGVPIAQGDSWDVSADGPNGCPVPLDEGLFLTNPVSGGTLLLLVSFGKTGLRTL